jgi:hypothetical protein
METMAGARLSTVKSTSSLAKARHYSIGQCHFAINSLRGGAFTADTRSEPYAGAYTGLLATDDPEFTIFCYPGANDDEISDKLGAKKINGKWVWLGTGEPFESAQHFKIFAFSGKNWTGRAVTYDDTNGDEAMRQRRFSFCLLQTGGSQVLCGTSSVMPLGYPKSNVLPKIMGVLRSIEFVTLPSPADANAASDRTTSNH